MIDKARIDDPPKIMALIREYARQETMLPRSLNNIYESLRDFHVAREGDEVTGCAALHISWQGLAEIRSVAVAEHAKGRGIGRALVQSCLCEARALEINQVFVLTYIPRFFHQFGFCECPKEALPHKIWADCINCPKFPDCDEVAMTLDLG